MSTGLPLVMTASGPQPTPPAALRQQLVDSVAATNPGFTANLPGSLIEDIVSTDVGALVVADQGRVETVNSLNPFGSNPFLTKELGAIYGIDIGEQSNTSVFVVFSGAEGFVIGKGFTISDGVHQYTASDGGVIGTGGVSPPLFFVATIQGSWVVSPNTVTNLVTSIPTSVGIVTVTNPNAGTPGLATGETEESYRSRCLEAGLAASQGMSRYLKTLLKNVSGVQSRLVSARQVTGGWEVLCGGGDPYTVANAIFQSVFFIPGLTPSKINITGITKANPGVVTTDINHGFVTGQNNVNISGCLGMTGANGGPYTVTVITPTTFSFGVDTTGFGTYTGGGVVTPNSRNVSVNINDYPDTYTIPYVSPLQQIVTMTITWNTSSLNFVSAAAIAQLAIPAITNYINSIAVGQPINILEMNAVFQDAISSILDPNLLVRLIFAVNIDGIAASPVSGESIILGDPESYFFANQSGITVVQG